MNAVVNTAPKTKCPSTSSSDRFWGPREQSTAAKGECSTATRLSEVNAGTEVFSLEKFVFYGLELVRNIVYSGWWYNNN